MSKTLTTALLFVGGLFGLNYLLKGRALSNLVFSNATPQTVAFEGATPIVVLSLLVQNTNSVGVLLNSIAGNVFAQDGSSWTLIGNVSNFTPQNIAPNAATPVLLNIRCNIVGIVNEVIQAIQFKNNSRVLRCDLTANIEGFQYSVPSFQLQVGI